MTWSQAGCVGAVLALLLTSAAIASDVDATNYTGPSKSEAREIVLGELAQFGVGPSRVPDGCRPFLPMDSAEVEVVARAGDDRPRLCRLEHS